MPEWTSACGTSGSGKGQGQVQYVRRAAESCRPSGSGPSNTSFSVVVVGACFRARARGARGHGERRPRCPSATASPQQRRCHGQTLPWDPFGPPTASAEFLATPSQDVYRFTNYPEAHARLKAAKARHPREDALEEFTQWTLLGEDITPKELLGETAAAPAQAPGVQTLVVEPAKEETPEEYHKRRVNELMHKGVNFRRGEGGKWYTIGGGGRGDCNWQVR